LAAIYPGASVTITTFWREIVMADGRRGTYTLHNGLLTVKTRDGTKTMQLGTVPPKVLARIMLHELKKKPKS
jgi:hypothetical protein